MNKNRVENCQLLERDLHNVCWHVISETLKITAPHLVAVFRSRADYLLPSDYPLMALLRTVNLVLSVGVRYGSGLLLVPLSCISVYKGQIYSTRWVIKCNKHDYLLCYRDELHSYMSRPLSGHSQAIKTCKSEISIAASVMGDQIEISAFGVTIYMGI